MMTTENHHANYMHINTGSVQSYKDWVVDYQDAIENGTAQYTWPKSVRECIQDRILIEVYQNFGSDEWVEVT